MHTLMTGTIVSQFGPEPRQNSSQRLPFGRTGKLARADESPFSSQEQAEAMGLKRALDSIVIGALTAGDRSLCLNANLAFAVLSANDRTNYTLQPEEARILAPHACRRKRVEFAVGRAAAHLALQHIGFENPSAVFRGEGGEPLWPEGTVGSITHCDPWSIAVVAKHSNRLSNRLVIGIDLENVQNAKRTDISHLICRDAELEWVHAGGDDPARLTMIFSAKEAVYKAFYPVFRRFIDFKEVQLSWLPEQSCFQGELLGAFGATVLPGCSCVVHCRRCNDLVFSYLVHAI